MSSPVFEWAAEELGAFVVIYPFLNKTGQMLKLSRHEDTRRKLEVLTVGIPES
jgi:hypothetical protein